MKCLGCGGTIPWDGKGLFAYTCRCGATTFYDEKTGLYPPSSFIMCLKEGKQLSHIDYYVGKSNHTSLEKEEFIKVLQSKGAVWSWECPECRDKVIKRTVLEVSWRTYPFEVHPALKDLMLAPLV